MLGVRNPRTGETDHWIDPVTPGGVGQLAARLRTAQVGWERAGWPARSDVLSAWAGALRRHRPTIVEALCADTGRRRESELEADMVPARVERWVSMAGSLLAEAAPVPSSVPGVHLLQDNRPYPLVGVISPWNFPFLLSVIDAVPALLAGCAVLVKPSEVTPRFVEPVMASVRHVPELEEVLAYALGAAETGGAVVDASDLVCFTGSVPTGRAVAQRAAERFVPAFLELGGKDPAIVLAGSDLDRASSAVLWGATANAGQSCLSIERVYVEEPVHDAFVDLLGAKAAALRLARPGPGDGDIGPIIAEKQIGVIEVHLADAFRKGARARCGGAVEYLDGGAWCRPTVLVDVDHSMSVMTEETFGPIVPVMRVADVDDAIRLANDTSYGLSAAVFAGSTDEGLAVARRLEAGAVSVNDAALTAVVHDGEKHAFKASGLGGSRMGPAALTRFGRRRSFLIREGDGPDPWWFDALRR